MLTQEELLEQIIAQIPAIDLDSEEDADLEVAFDEEYQDQREAELQVWANKLPVSAIPTLLDIINLPQDTQHELSPNGNGNEICGIAIDGLVVMGERFPDEVEAAFLKLLSNEDTQGLALEGIAIWESPRMLPVLADVLEGTDDSEIAYLVGAALYAIGGEEGIRLLKRLKEKFADDEEVVQQTEDAIELLED